MAKKTEAQVVATAFNDLCQRNQLAVNRLSEITHDPLTPPILKLALEHVEKELLAPSETALLFSEMSKGEVVSLDIIADHQIKNHR